MTKQERDRRLSAYIERTKKQTKITAWLFVGFILVCWLIKVAGGNG